MKSFTKVEELLDGDAKAYLKELHIQVDDIFVTLETWNKELALEKVNKLAAWDEVKMQELTHSSKPVSGAIIGPPKSMMVCMEHWGVWWNEKCSLCFSKADYACLYLLTQ